MGGLGRVAAQNCKFFENRSTVVAAANWPKGDFLPNFYDKKSTSSHPIRKIFGMQLPYRKVFQMYIFDSACFG